MARLNLVYLLCLFLATVTLAACQTGGGYGSYRSWGGAPAEQPPKPLAGQNVPAADMAIQREEIVPAEAVKPYLPPVKVAILLPLSGQHASLGQAMLNAAQIALFDVAYGGFELLPQDTKGTPEGARYAAQQAAPHVAVGHRA